MYVNESAVCPCKKTVILIKYDTFIEVTHWFTKIYKKGHGDGDGDIMHSICFVAIVTNVCMYTLCLDVI